MADFAYVRFMGERDLTKFVRFIALEDTNLQIWKKKSKDKSEKYLRLFQQFYEGHAPASVNKLKELFGHEMSKRKFWKIKVRYFSK